MGRMMNKRYGFGRQRGLTLVEIMVAMVVSMILIAGVIQIFVGTRQTYRFQDALARVQENGRFAVDHITRDARLAGYSGCTTLVSVVPTIIPPLTVEYSRANYIGGIAAAPAGNPFNAVAGTDVLTLRMLEPTVARLSVNMGGPGDVLTIPANPGNLANGEIIGVADCNGVDVFRITAVGGGTPVTLQAHDDLTRAYLEGALVSRFREVSYFVRDGASGRPSLWRRVVGDAVPDQELLEGVEDLWVRYGIDLNNDGSPEAYVAADAVANWSRVRSLRVSLLLASNEGNITAGPQPVDFRGAAVAVGDNRYRQVLTTTIGLRNRLP